MIFLFHLSFLGDEEQVEMPYTVGERNGTKQYICTWCQKPFTFKHNFAQHYRHVHLKMRPKLRACYLCPVKVPTYMRAKHLEEAHGVPMPQCNACGKKFAFPFQVTQHQKAYHMNERDYACTVCDMRFTVPSKLAHHALKHSSIRPYQCEYCDKAFRWKKNLKTHVMAHLNDKRHVCFVCSEAFVQSSSLKYHITKKHPELA
ncbi:hypothetical protein ABMA27_012807 [Loxostege sticticalis]|uniref:C2H2-type domain-containing protein n=1 Tax=Loxostege sticticalis TaxID=481309 RepID=A0ABR3GZU4_LOXSC